MNQRAYPPRPAEARRAGIRLVLSLLPVVAISAPSVAPETIGPAPRPYLAAVGAPALRFGEAPPPPPLWVRPAAGAPPTNPTAESPANAAGPEAVAPIATDPAPVAATVAPEIVLPATPAAPARTPAPILPDDTRPKVRAEDFLPFFQFPGSAASAGDVTVVTPVVPGNAPAPAPQPRSSATYRQQ